MIKKLPFVYRLSIFLLVVIALLGAPACLGLAATSITGTPKSPSSGSNQIASFDDSKFVETSLPSNVVDTLKSAMTDFITLQAQTSHFDIKSLQIDITSEKSNGNEVEVAFYTQYQHRLNIASPDDAAVIKGQMKYLNTNSQGMSAQSVGIVQDRIAQWKPIISNYMNTYVPLNGAYKVTAQLDGDNNIVPGTVKLYGEDDLGNYIPADNFIGYSDNEVEQQSYDATKMHLDNYSKMAGTVQSASIARLLYSYSGGAALNYAVAWTADYPTDIDCGDGTTRQNHNYYNNSSYTWYQCNDCANYVSQSMHAGGIPTDSTWYGNSSTTSLAWRYVPSLEDYMTSNGHWSSTNWSGLLSGGVIELTNQGHVMMCIYNDGSLMEYAAHTSDKKYWSWSSGSSAYYWNVS